MGTLGAKAAQSLKRGLVECMTVELVGNSSTTDGTSSTHHAAQPV